MGIATFGWARKTKKGGRSGGTAVLWKSHLKAGEILGATSKARAVSVSMYFGGVGVVKLTSVYGFVGISTKTLDLLKQCLCRTFGGWSPDCRG